ncbi:WXG100 family type VII secretion target [Streptomyces yangpuensis]|uniref:WXG100 family type VII secretion target n=1 Tax=unclassified Streptomyces TaxID=2593676 RepID=UPI0009909E41|nr:MULTISPECIES: WXG100 family type VII secretion target [unclassified Streptomyces]AQT73759.1 WXG100 family type VII secretion target [Streptomyces sp. fd1-xmd]MDX6761715.1 WXG100 family type VII secretion target [Streptomyces sp. F8]
MQDSDLRVSEDGLTRLADDLDQMQGHLERQIRDMDRVVDSIAAGWQGPTATAYRSLHRGAAEDAVRIRQVLALLEEATRAARDGFTAQELEILAAFKQVQSQEDVAASAEELTVPDQAPAAPQSRLQDI